MQYRWHKLLCACAHNIKDVVSHYGFLLNTLYWINSKRISETVNGACQSDGRLKIDLQYHIELV